MHTYEVLEKQSFLDALVSYVESKEWGAPEILSDPDRFPPELQVKHCVWFWKQLHEFKKTTKKINQLTKQTNHH